MSKKLILLTLATILVAVLISAGATAGSKQTTRRSFSVGIYDDGMTLGNPDKGFPILHNLRAQIVRVTLWWGGPIGVAKTRPVNPTNPADPAYNWSAYDRAMQDAAKYKIKVLFSIVGTPSWANGRRAARYAPTNSLDLKRFAIAAAKRYSGTFHPTTDGPALPAAHLWLAWNEPNNPVFLSPQYRKVHGRWIAQSAYSYVRICNAVWSGVHSVQHSAAKVACGGTDPRGNNNPRSKTRASIAPLTFLRYVKKYHLRHFDAWAHHPYASRPSQKPTTKPNVKDKNTVLLGNIGDLTKQLTKLYGKKPIWITEYGYQTRPPDRTFGVAWRTQAKYLSQAYSIARKNSRIQMMIWFLVKDESRLAGWQSGFFTTTGKRKPAYTAFRALKH
jgi:hypothetical protein